MQTDTVQTQSQPMIYVRHRTKVGSGEISRMMGEAFQTLGAFINEHGIEVAGPPLSIYHDYTDAGMTMDVGFPVSAAALAKATGAIRAGETPSGKAIKVVHKGSYENLRTTYGEIEADFKAKGLSMGPMTWEIYVNDPETTAEADLVTEILTKVD